MVIYHIEDEIISSATRIIFTHDPKTNQLLCLKMWRPCKNDVYDTLDKDSRLDVVKSTKYQLEGLAFNRRYAPGVYLGMAKIPMDDTLKEPDCGPLIEEPDSSIVKDNHRYAVVMKQLDEKWRLDRLISSDIPGNERRIDFLARTCAEMHKYLEISPPERGTLASIITKIEGNCAIFNKLWQLPLYTQRDIAPFKPLEKLLKDIAEKYKYLFVQRLQNSHIRRCHADLKATNLWLYPQESSSPQLLLLDCVDFNPNFCHIDTLSDVAMLAVNLEMYLTRLSNSSEAQADGEKLVQYFLKTYLQYANEKTQIWPLLEFYIIEKAMICAYNYLYIEREYVGGDRYLGENYLDVVINHTKHLKDYLI